MAAVYAIWKRLGQVRLDGVSYDIGMKEREDGRIFVAWVCLECCDQGPPTPAGVNLEQAIEFTKIGLRAHHALFHRVAALDSSLTAEVAKTCETPGSTCNGPDPCRDAFARAKAMFEELCDLYIRMHDGRVQPGEFSVSSDTFLHACRNWDDAVRAYQNVLEAYSEELAKRAEALHQARAESIA